MLNITVNTKCKLDLNSALMHIVSKTNIKSSKTLLEIQSIQTNKKIKVTR